MYSVVMLMTMSTAPDITVCGNRGGCRGYGGCYGGCTGYGGGSGNRYGGCGGGGCGGYAYGGSGRMAYGNNSTYPSYSYSYPYSSGYTPYPAYSGNQVSPNGTIVNSPNGTFSTVSNPRTTQDGFVGDLNSVNWQQITASDGTVKLAAPAMLEVVVPEDAKISIDSKSSQATGTVRVFETPPLETGKDFTYQVTATATREGKEMKVEKQVTVRAGRATRATIDFRASPN
jgi:uncharacterized protein (TIGR03000 family)